MKFNLPSRWTLVFSLGAGVLALLNQTTFGLPVVWHSALNVALVFFGAIGISPLVGAKFRAALHLNPAESLVVTAALSALSVASTQFAIGGTAKAIVTGVLAFLAGLGFAPVVV